RIPRWMQRTRSPPQRALNPLEDKANAQEEQKHHHRPEPQPADLVERDRPGKEERDLQVEQDEQDRDEVVAHVELHARVLERLEAALVRGELLAVGAVRPEEGAGGDKDPSEDQRYRDEQQDREVVFQHLSK